jgi:hypothetical protein
MKWKAKLRLIEQITTAYRRLLADNIPTISTYSDILMAQYRDWVPPGCERPQAPGPLKDIIKPMLGLVKQVSRGSHLRSACEAEYFPKLLPRNVQLAIRMPSLFEVRPPIPMQPLTSAEWQFSLRAAARYMGLGRSKPCCDIYDIRPPKAQASTGIFQGIMGKKNDFWFWILNQADKLRNVIEQDSYLDLNRVYDPSYLQSVCIKYDLVFRLLTRVDNNLWKPRRIWDGSSLMYVLERFYLGNRSGSHRCGLMLDYNKASGVATTGDKCRAYSRATRDRRRISRDASNWDRSWWWRYMVDQFLILGQLYQVPPSFLVLYIAYNVAAPFVTPDLGLQFQLGEYRSGVGSFSQCNTWNRVAMNLNQTMSYDGLVDYGIACGDDDVVATEAPLDWLVADSYVRFNVIEKPEAQIVSTKGYTICRRIYEDDTKCGLPIVWSIVRNALCPVEANCMIDPEMVANKSPRSPYGLTKFEVALARRAQSLNLVMAAQSEDRYVPLEDYWFKSICPESTLLLDIEEAELVAALPKFSRHYDDLTWIRARL